VVLDWLLLSDAWLEREGKEYENGYQHPGRQCRTARH
jgi:hypothetical protein